jgi:hypothetical protein
VLRLRHRHAVAGHDDHGTRILHDEGGIFGAARSDQASPIPAPERLMVLKAPERFGYFYDNAMGTSYLLQNGIIGVPHQRSLFARWGSQLKKFYLLAIFSFVRLHQVQGLMNLRQVLEAAVDAAFAVAHPDHIKDYGYTDKHGAIMTPQSFKKKRYAWLAANCKNGSDSIQSLKEAINRYGSHASVMQTMNNLQVQLGAATPHYQTSFFDAEDGYHVKTDLWRSANVALATLDLLYGVNRDFGVLTFAEDFLTRLVTQHEALGEEMRATERFQDAQRKLADRGGVAP